MKILLLQIDKTQDSYISQGVETYVTRLQNYARVDIQTINVPKAVRQRSQNEQKTEESRLFMQVIAPEDHVILLDENGKQFTSMEFSKLISQKQNASTKRLIFAVGGPFGFDDKMYERANAKLSLSKMTFSHQMVRLFFVEQLYRAFTILKGEKYHHE